LGRGSGSVDHSGSTGSSRSNSNSNSSSNSSGDENQDGGGGGAVDEAAEFVADNSGCGGGSPKSISSSSIQLGSSGKRRARATRARRSGCSRQTRPGPLPEGAALGELQTRLSMCKVDVPWAPLVVLPLLSTPSSPISFNAADDTAQASDAAGTDAADASKRGSLFGGYSVGGCIQSAAATSSVAQALTTVTAVDAGSDSWSLPLVAAEPLWADGPLTNGQALSNGHGLASEDTDWIEAPVDSPNDAATATAALLSAVAAPSLQGCAALVSRGRGPFHEKVSSGLF
jgi:hypothetical protein